MRISDWSSDVCSSDLDRTEVPMTDDEQARVAALEAESEALCEQWSEVPDVPAEVHARIDAIDAELGALVDRPLVFDPAEMGRAGAFVSIDRDGSVRNERGFVRAERSEEHTSELQS